MKCGFFFGEGSGMSLAPFPISGNEIRFENMRRDADPTNFIYCKTIKENHIHVSPRRKS